MAKLNSYNGTIPVAAGFTQKGTGDFPLMEAHSIVVDESGTRLDEKLQSIGSGGGTGGGSGLYVLELTGTVGTLTDEQYAALVANAPNVCLKMSLASGVVYAPVTSYSAAGEYFFVSSKLDYDEQEDAFYNLSVVAEVKSNKSYQYQIRDSIDGTPWVASKSYVDNLFGSYITEVDNLVGGGL